MLERVPEEMPKCPKKCPKKCPEGRNRTTDTRIFNPLLYRLSYLGMRIAKNTSLSVFWVTLYGLLSWIALLYYSFGSWLA